jgi:hypothetical protein
VESLHNRLHAVSLTVGGLGAVSLQQTPQNGSTLALGIPDRLQCVVQIGGSHLGGFLQSLKQNTRRQLVVK